MEEVKELENQVDYAVKYKDLEEQHKKLLVEYETLQGKYGDAVATAQNLANKVMNFVTPAQPKEESNATDLETIIKNVLGGK